MKKMAPVKPKCSITVLGIGFTLLILGLILSILWPFIFISISKSELELSVNSTSYKMWVKTPLPLYMDIYIFNYTNYESINNHSVKPKFEEIGPFVFLEVHERANVSWNNNYTVTFFQKRTWQFQPNLSLPLNTEIVTINPLLVASAHTIKNNASWIHIAINLGIKAIHEKPITKTTAGNWIFNGFSDPLLTLLNKLNIPLPMPKPHDKFGWFYARNESITYDGLFNMYTGGDNIYKLGALNTWNNKNISDSFKGDCGNIRGSTGDIISPLSQKTFSLFVPDFCSTLDLSFSGLKNIEHLTGYNFIGDDKLFDNGTVYPDRKCICNGECVPSGVYNVTSCKYGSPIFISYPHFYLADEYYLNKMDGLSPNKTLHETSFVIEPTSGVPLSISAKFQINMHMEPYKWLDCLSKVQDMYVPMIWFHQRAVITPEIAKLAKRAVNIDVYGVIACYTILAVGLVAVLIGSVCFALRKKYELELLQPPLITSEETDESLNQS